MEAFEPKVRELDYWLSPFLELEESAARSFFSGLSATVERLLCRNPVCFTAVVDFLIDSSLPYA
jgi:hypothetical protein